MSSLFSSTLTRIGFLPWIRSGNGTLQIFLPEWFYDLLVFLFFPFNWLLAFLPSRFPCEYNSADWALDPDKMPTRLAPPKTGLTELAVMIRRRGNERLSDHDVWCLFDSLAPPTTNDLIGNWRGKVIYTRSWIDLAGHSLERPLRFIGCDWGKRFLTPYRGDPLIFILWNRIIIPVPMWGSVSIPEIAFRGKSGATMTYDHQPWKDHFRILDDGHASGRRMILGNWMSREKMGGWFTLEALPEMDEAVKDFFARSPY